MLFLSAGGGEVGASSIGGNRQGESRAAQGGVFLNIGMHTGNMTFLLGILKVFNHYFIKKNTSIN